RDGKPSSVPRQKRLGRAVPPPALVSLHLEIFVLDNRFNDDVAITHGSQRSGGAEASQRVDDVFGLGAADGDAALQHLRDAPDALFQSLRYGVGERDRNTAANVRPGNPCTHDPAATHT